MKTLTTIGLIILASILISAPLQADEGKASYENNCTGCHGTDVFTRDERSIDSLESLKKRVNACNGAVDNKLSDDEIKSVTEYLNRFYYKF